MLDLVDPVHCFFFWLFYISKEISRYILLFIFLLYRLAISVLDSNFRQCIIPLSYSYSILYVYLLFVCILCFCCFVDFHHTHTHTIYILCCTVVFCLLLKAMNNNKQKNMCSFLDGKDYFLCFSVKHTNDNNNNKMSEIAYDKDKFFFVFSFKCM